MKNKEIFKIITNRQEKFIYYILNNKRLSGTQRFQIQSAINQNRYRAGGTYQAVLNKFRNAYIQEYGVYLKKLEEDEN